MLTSFIGAISIRTCTFSGKISFPNFVAIFTTGSFRSRSTCQRCLTRRPSGKLLKVPAVKSGVRIHRAITGSPVNDVVIKWKHFPRYWPFVQGIHRPPVKSPHKGQWRGTLVFSLICAWINGIINNHEAGYLSRHRAHYDVIIMIIKRNFGIFSEHSLLKCQRAFILIW